MSENNKTPSKKSFISKLKARAIKALGGITEEECLVIGSTLYQNNQDNLDQIRRLQESIKNITSELDAAKKRNLNIPELDESNKDLKKKIKTSKSDIKKLTSELRDKESQIYKLREEIDKKHKKTNRFIPDTAKLKAWSKRVREVGKCDCCGSTDKLTAHHLWDKNTHGSLMYQDENGVCLCLSCHNKFHKTYTSKSQVTPKLYNIFKIREQNDANRLKAISSANSQKN